MFEVGSIVAGKYRVDGELGKGGMGKVVSATHVHLGTRVALKYLNDAMMVEETMVQRFLREARSSAQLQNEHICRVVDFGTEGLTPYIVMELLEGTDLAKLVRHNPLDVATASEYVVQACLGLTAAHAAGIVHRDLKPSNLFLVRRPDGSPLVKVFDFGVAKAPEAVDVNLTQTASVVGSPGYMSPEQVRSSKNVDARSDIWALGVILYKLVSMRMPFKAESITDLAVAIAMDPTPPLGGIVPPAFEAIVMRCLEKDPNRRFQDVSELIAALSPFTQLGPRDTVPFDIVPPPRTSMQFPAVGGAEQPTTMRGSSGVIVAGVQPPERNLRPWIIGAALSIAIGVGVGLTWTGGSTSPQPAAHVMSPVVETVPEPVTPPPVAPSPVATPPEAVVAAPPVQAKPRPAIRHATATTTTKPIDKPSEPEVVVPPSPPPPPAKPKDIGASRI